MYGHTLNVLTRPPFERSTVVLAPVETVGSVAYHGLDRYNPDAPPTTENVVFTYRRRELSEGGWTPRYSEQPFRWSLLWVTQAVDYGTIAEGAGAGFAQRTLGRIGQWYVDSDLPRIKAVEEVFDDETGLGKFKAASAKLAEGRLLKPPYHVYRAGLLMEPVPS
jgi:hypothetical protein